MPFELRFALRNLVSRRGGFARLTAFAAMSGVAFGVASLIVVQAIYLGFRTGIESSLLSQTAHITVNPAGRDVIAPSLVRKKLLAIPNIERVDEAIFRSSVIMHGDEAAHGLLRVEFDPQSPANVEAEVFLGNTLANNLGAKRGSEVVLVVPGPEGEAAEFAAKVGGFVETGIYEYDTSLVKISWPDYLKLNPSAAAQQRSFLVFLESPFEAEEVAEEVRQAVGPSFSVSDWRSSNRPLFTALSFERKISAAVFSLMIGISSLGIMATLVLLVNDRRVDLAVLKTCGARSRSLALIFLIEGIAVGGTGILAGVAIGSILCSGFNYFEMISLPGEVYSISKLTLIQDPITLLLITGGALLLIIPSILVPVTRAARIKPAEILRNA